jgi:GDP-D-mannose 3',5'-epimerase
MQNSLTILTTGRNDNYDGNFNERLIIALNQNMQRLPEGKFVFVEWNPIPDKRLVCEDLQVAFGDKVKYYVVHPDFHSTYCTFDGFNEYPAKNVAIRRATTDFILSINSDVILSPEVVEKLKGSLKRNTVYRAVRIDIRPDYLQVKFPILPKFIMGENRGTLNACGDFLLMDRDSWHQSTGYMEDLPDQRLHKDSEFVYRVSEVGKKAIEFLGSITHWRHKSSWSNSNENRPRVGDINWNYKKLNYLRNLEDWGLTQAKEENRNGITWLVPDKKKLFREPKIIVEEKKPEMKIEEPKINLPLIRGQKTALVLGGHGFIGHHLARDLKRQGFWVRTVDIKEFPYDVDFKDDVDDYVVGDLRDINVCKYAFRGLSGKPFDEVYQLSAKMGGAGFIFTSEHDSEIMHDSMLLNVNVANMAYQTKVEKLFFSSSACVYNQANQESTQNPNTAEDTAYPANPDSAYGFEKLIAEQLFQAFNKNHGLSIRIARFHNVFGPEGAWGNGREKSPAAICRKVAQAKDGDTIEIWGDGNQTRSFLYIDECLLGLRKFMDSNFQGPLNIGSDEMVSINQLVEMAKEIAGKPKIKISHVEGPLGVRGRTSDNRLIRQKLGWAPNYPLMKGLKKTFKWIDEQVKQGVKDYSWTS